MPFTNTIATIYNCPNQGSNQCQTIVFTIHNITKWGINLYEVLFNAVQPANTTRTYFFDVCLVL